ncbi:MAG: hypothetical protein WCI72_00980 [archaeon]
MEVIIKVITMQSLENQVREALVQKRADETYTLMTMPKYQEQMSEVARTIMRTVAEAMGPAEIPRQNKLDSLLGVIPEEVTPYSEELSRVDDAMKEVFSNPEQLKQAAMANARNAYISRSQLEAQCDALYKQISVDEDLGNKALEEFKRANEALYGFADSQDKFVAGLVAIAQKDGVQRALTKEAEREVTRNMFPTAEEYISYSLRGIKVVKDYFTNVQKAMMIDEDVQTAIGIDEGIGQLMGAAYRGIQKAIEGIEEMDEQAQTEKIYQRAKEIYGE